MGDDEPLRAHYTLLHCDYCITTKTTDGRLTTSSSLPCIGVIRNRPWTRQRYRTNCTKLRSTSAQKAAYSTVLCTSKYSATWPMI